MNQPKTYSRRIEVLAIQWTGENGDEVQTFLCDGHKHSAAGWVKGSYVEIGALDQRGVPTIHNAHVGDWIVKETVPFLSDGVHPTVHMKISFKVMKKVFFDHLYLC